MNPTLHIVPTAVSYTHLFRVLNYAYAMDKTAVYTTSGRIPDVELAAFQVLDNGQNDSGAPQGLSLIHI